MTITYTPITLAQLTTATTDGTGVFDVLMTATKAHLEQEFLKGRIKGTEYATVYLGSLQSVMNAALQFTLEREKQNLEAQLRAKEIELAGQEIALKQEQVLVARAEVGIAEAKLVNIPKEGDLLDAQVAQTYKQVSIADQEIAIKEQQVLVAQAEVGIAEAKLANIPKEGAVLDAQASEIAQRTLLVRQQTTNAITENAVLVGQECKLRAEFDMIREQVLKSASETALLNQKIVTERAQTTAIGVDADSVIGRQKTLYGAQAEGFQRDAEQKAADLMIKSWATRRTTDEGTVADNVNMLNDTAIGRAVNKLLSGVGA